MAYYPPTTSNANALTGTTLASNVVNSSLTSVGTLSSLSVSNDVTVDTNTLKVDSTNNRVGIGTASPAFRLQIADASGYGVSFNSTTNEGLIGANNDADLLRITGGQPDNVVVGGNIYLYGNTHATRLADVSLNSNGNEVLTVDGPTLNVGIGTTSPTSKLSVTGTLGVTGAATLSSTLSVGAVTGGTYNSQTISTAANLTGSLTVANDITAPSLSGTASGNQNNFVRLGQSTTDSSSIPGTTQYGNLRTSCGYGVGISWISTGGTGPGGFVPNMHAVFLAGGTHSGDIRSNSSGATSYNTTSDYRLKENVIDLENGIECVRQLKPKRFNFKNDTVTMDGFIAHEVQEIIPVAVSGQKDHISDTGEPIYQSMDSSWMIPVLTSAIKNLDDRILSLETIIAQQQTIIDSLTNAQ